MKRVAVIAGDSIAGEASGGTLRYLLVRPVGRTRLLVAKLVAVLAFLLVAVTSVAATAYVVGTHLFGSSTALTSLSGIGMSAKVLMFSSPPKTEW